MKKIVIVIYEILIFLPILILSSIITAIIVMIGVSIGDKVFWSYYPPKYWSKIICFAALCRINVASKANLDPNQSYVFIANHQGIFDVFLIYGYLGHNVKWVQKQELRKIPFVGKASEMAGHVFVNQSSLKSMKETIHKVTKNITHGTSIALFPEGARTKTGRMGQFKRGAFIIAKELELPVVPITVNGAFDVMKIHTYLINPGKLELIIHEPISTIGLSEERLSQIMKESENTIHADLWKKYK